MPPLSSGYHAFIDYPAIVPPSIIWPLCLPHLSGLVPLLFGQHASIVYRILVLAPTHCILCIHAQYMFIVQVANSPPGLQACSFDIESFHRTNPVVPDHKPWLVVQGTKGDFFIDHTHPFGASSASSNVGMVGNAIVDIWVSEGIGPIAKYEDDFSVYRVPVPDGLFTNGDFHYAYDKEEAASRISSLGVPWHKEKGDPCFLSTHLYWLLLGSCQPYRLSPN